jgi:ribosomal protein S27E
MLIVCSLCNRVIINDGVNCFVYYSCAHIEHEDRYYDSHPSNVICLICGVVSNGVFFH